MKRLIKTLYAACTCLSIVACAGSGLGGSEHARWTEEVKLSDGKVIQIQRHVEIGAPMGRLEDRGSPRYHEICYPPMGIHWKSRPGYKPDIFDIVGGKAYIHVSVSSQLQCYEQGSPATGAIYFVWENETWQRITHDEFPAASEWNLMMQVSRGPSKNDPKGLITIEGKTTGRRQDNSLRLEQERLGWKRVSESFAERTGCKPYYSNVPVGCADASCTRVIEGATPISIFFDDNRNTCQP